MILNQKIKELYYLSTDKEKEEGKKWYWEAHNYATGLGYQYSIECYKVAALLSLFSPIQSWERTKFLTEEFLYCQDCKYLGVQKEKARLLVQPYLYRDVEQIKDLIKGQKTTNFFMNIAAPFSFEYCTIDEHMRKGLIKEQLTPKRYNFLAQSITTCAEELDLVPNQLQAILWLHFKNNKKP